MTSYKKSPRRFAQANSGILQFNIGDLAWWRRLALSATRIIELELHCMMFSNVFFLTFLEQTKALAVAI